MMNTFIGTLKLSFNRKETYKNVDSIWSMLHYRATSAMLFACFLLVSSQQHFGNPINCLTDYIGDKPIVPENVINSFCFMSTTYSVISKNKNSREMEGNFEMGTPYPGVQPFAPATTIKNHAYYQWVPLVLLFQSILFTIPKCVWMAYERGLVGKLIQTLDDVVECSLGSHVNHPRIKSVASYFKKSLGENSTLGAAWILTDFLALFITLGNFYLVDVLMDGQFFHLGSESIKKNFMENLNSTAHQPFNLFPLLTKCTMNKYGSSGNIQNIDAMCVMNLNIVNEKIYLVLWFWFLLLVPITTLGIIIKLESIAFLKFFPRSHWQSTIGVPTRISSRDITICSANMSFADCVLFELLASNMRPLTYKVFVTQVAVTIMDSYNHIKIV